MNRIRFACLAMLLASVAGAAETVSLGEAVTWAASPTADAVAPGLDLGVPVESGGEPSDLVIQLRKIDIAFRADVVEVTSVRVMRYESDEAVRDYGNIPTTFNAATDSVVVDEAFVVDAAGDIHVVDPATVQVFPNDTDEIFSDSQTVLIPLTGLGPGARALVATTLTTDRSKDFGPWGAYFSEQFGVPMDSQEISLSWESPELRPQWRSSLEGMVCEERANGVKCRAENVPAYPVDEDVYYDDVTPQFLVSESGSWERVREWYRPLFYSAVTGSDAIVRKARELGEGVDDKRRLVEKIHEFVSGDIRYVGLEHGASAFVPHESELTLSRRYGDCKDKTALMIDLLQQHGVEAHPVLVATSRRDPTPLMIPSQSYFDHLIVCGELSSGYEFCLDPTDPYSSGRLSNWVQGAVALPLNREGGPTTLPEEDYRWVLRESLELRLDADGKLAEHGELRYEGGYAAQIRSVLSGMMASELVEWATRDYHSTVSDLVEPEFEFDGIDVPGGPVTVSWETSFDDMLDPETYLWYTEPAAWLSQTIGFFESDNDTFAYRFPGLRVESVVTMLIDEQWPVRFTGADIDMRSDHGSLVRQYRLAGQRVEIETKFESPARLVAPGKIDEFNRFLELAIDQSAIHVFGDIE